MLNLTSRDGNDNIPVSVNEGGTKSIGNVILVSDLFSTSLALRTKECMHRCHASHVTHQLGPLFRQSQEGEKVKH